MRAVEKLADMFYFLSYGREMSDDRLINSKAASNI
jgi:hypothetical protein